MRSSTRFRRSLAAFHALLRTLLRNFTSERDTPQFVPLSPVRPMGGLPTADRQLSFCWTTKEQSKAVMLARPLHPMLGVSTTQEQGLATVDALNITAPLTR